MNYGEEKTCGGRILWDPRCVCSRGTLNSRSPAPPQPCPGPPSAQVLGPDRSIPRSGGARGRPRTSAAPGGGGACTEGGE